MQALLLIAGIIVWVMSGTLEAPPLASLLLFGFCVLPHLK